MQGAQFICLIDRVDVNALAVRHLLLTYKHKATKDLKAYSAKLSLDSELSKEILPRHVQSAIYAQIMRKQLTKYKLEPVAAIYLGNQDKKISLHLLLQAWQQKRQQNIFWNMNWKIKA